jgi:hypothetical protein
MVLPFLIACGGSEPASQIERASSWAATTRELAIERGVGGIGQAYTVDLLDAGRRDVRKITQSLKPSTLPEPVRARVPAAVAQLDSVMMRASDAVQRGDAVALGTAAASADAIGDTLRVMRAALGSK